VGTQSDATVNFNGNSYHLPAWSVSILPDCKNVVLNTAKVCLMSLHCIILHFDSSRFPWFIVDAQDTRIFCAKCVNHDCFFSVRFVAQFHGLSIKSVLMTPMSCDSAATSFPS
jgi:hypothetical protein